MISVFDLMTLNIALRVALGSMIIFTKFDLSQSQMCENWRLLKMQQGIRTARLLSAVD